MHGCNGTGGAERIEARLRGWFPGRAFVKAAAIGDHPILPEEQALVVGAVPRRRHEFATGRWLSRQGLRHFGLPDRPVGMGRLRNPLWPDSIIGTISHDGAHCAVVLMERSGPVAGIGIDLIALAQRAGRMEELTPMFVAGPGELDAVAALCDAVEPAMLLFSLKESVIKALAHRLTDFIDMRDIVFGWSDGLRVGVHGQDIGAAPFAATTGRYLVTAVTV
ncbi:MAG TPA: 4'-phosphopantetheinyl transferase superfamily protein [Azospirillum sp.]